MTRQTLNLCVTLGGFLPLLCIIMCEGKSGPGESFGGTTVPTCTPRIIRTIPHDGSPFTQGFCYEGGVLYESAGLYGESAVRKLDTNGTILSVRSLSPQIFAEGCALLGSRLFQISWREERCFVYRASDLILYDSIAYSGEGWGLCAAGNSLIMSNGSDTLYARNEQFSLIGKTAVTCGGKPLANLNELEYARGRIFANVWYSDYLFEIDPQRGTAVRIIDCKEIVKQENPPSSECVLNGIAYRPETGLFYITGKKWKNIYIVEIPAL